MINFLILPKEAPAGKKIFIVTSSGWNDMVRYIIMIEEQGYIATNSGLKNNYKAEIDAANCFTTLRGWSDTQLGQDIFYYAKSRGIPIIPREDLFKPKTESEPDPAPVPPRNPEFISESPHAHNRKSKDIIPVPNFKQQKRKPTIFENDR